MGAGPDGDHHLRHVGPALVPGSDPSGRRAGSRHEPDDRRRAGQGRAHHPRPQQLHGRLQGPSRAQARPVRPQGREPAHRHRRLVQQDPRRGEGGLPDRPVRRRLRRRPARARRARPGRSRSRPSRSATRTPSATRASRSGTCSRAGASTTCMLMGVHTNMCVLGRPFGLRQLVLHGKNALLVRDLTDTMYNSRKWPYVSHFQGTDRIIEHIEKFVAPTITSTDLTGQPAVPVPARRPPPRRLPDRRGRVPDREDAAGIRPQGAGAAGHPLHVRDRRPEVAARLPGSRGARRRRPAGPERPPPRPRGRRRWRSSAVTSRPASRSWASGRPATPSTPAATPRRDTPSGRRSTRTCSEAITPAITATTSSRSSSGSTTKKPDADPRRGRDAVHGPGLALQDEPAGVVGDALVDGHDPRPSARAGRVDQPRRATPGSSTRRWATPATSTSRLPPPAPQCRALGARSADQASSTPGPRRRRGVPRPFRTRPGPARARRGPGQLPVPDDLELELVLAEPIVAAAGLDQLRRARAALGRAVPAISRIPPA